MVATTSRGSFNKQKGARFFVSEDTAVTVEVPVADEDDGSYPQGPVGEDLVPVYFINELTGDLDGEELVGKQKDRAGQSICGGLKFSLTEIRGDWLYHKQVFRFRSSWKGGTNLPVCFQCPAMASGVNRYYHVDASTPLWSIQYDLIQFLVQQLPETEVCVQTIDQYTL